MGLLDSNKMVYKPIAIDTTSELTSTGTIANTYYSNLGGAYNRCKIAVTGIAGSSTVDISVYRGINSLAENKKIFYATKNIFVEKITYNGEYYIDLSDAINFKLNNNTAYSGGTTVRFQIMMTNVPSFMDTLELRNQIVSLKHGATLETSITLSNTGIVTLGGGIQDIDCGNYSCLKCLIKNGNTSANIKFVDKTLGTGNALPVFNEKGEINPKFTTGSILYVIVGNGSIVNVVNNIALSGSILLDITPIDEMPSGIVEIKPIQSITSGTVNATPPVDEQHTNSMTTLVSNLNVANFKYFFVQYVLRNGDSATVKEVTLSVSYNVLNLGTYASNISTKSLYCYSTPWQEIDGNEITIIADIASYAEGDKVYFNIFGVR